MRVFLYVAVSAVVLSACAKQPENIAAAAMPTAPYERMSCAELAGHALAKTQQIEGLSAEQRDAASGDALGVFLLGLPLSSMSGGDQETAIAIARGEMNAITAVQQSRGCL